MYQRSREALAHSHYCRGEKGVGIKILDCMCRMSGTEREEEKEKAFIDHSNKGHQDQLQVLVPLAGWVNTYHYIDLYIYIMYVCVCVCVVCAFRVFDIYIKSPSFYQLVQGNKLWIHDPGGRLVYMWINLILIVFNGLFQNAACDFIGLFFLMRVYVFTW